MRRRYIGVLRRDSIMVRDVSCLLWNRTRNGDDGSW